MQPKRLVVISALAALFLVYWTAETRAGGQRGPTDQVQRLEFQIIELTKRVESLERVCGVPIKRTYLGIGTISTLRNIARQGGQLMLADGSRWDICSEDRAIALKWALPDEILIEASPNPKYPYALVNRRRQELVEAQFAGKS